MRRIIIGGAGIGGLTAAFALAQAGIAVSVFERRSQLEELGAGLQLAPNATRILGRMGLLDAVAAQAMEPQAIRIRRGRDATELASLPIGDARRRYGAPFLVIHRADLHQVLAERVQRLPSVTTAFERHISEVEQGGTGVSVSLDTPSGALAQEADGFVDAGGLHGLRPNAGPLRESSRVAWRALVPAAALSRADGRVETNLWLGPQAHLVHYPLRGGSTVNLVAITPDDGSHPHGTRDAWSEAGDPAQLLRSFRGWHRDALRLIEAAPHWRRWPLLDRAPSKRWTDGVATRLGDAAHPMLPFLGQGASQAIEDADTLAWALRQSEDIRVAFAGYEARRHARATRVQQASRRQGDLYHLRRPMSDARDLAMRLLGSRRTLARMDWLYREPEPAESGSF